jgi:hypothetical protein
MVVAALKVIPYPGGAGCPLTAVGCAAARHAEDGCAVGFTCHSDRCAFYAVC